MNTQKTLIEEYKQKLIKETKKFCDKYLDQEYCQLCEKMLISYLIQVLNLISALMTFAIILAYPKVQQHKKQK